MTTHGEFMQWLSNNIEIPPSRFYSKPGERAEWVEMMKYQLFDFWLEEIK